MFITRCIKKGLVTCGMMACAFTVSAYPMLTFDGGVVYDAETGSFDIQGSLTGSQEIAQTLELVGSTFKLFSEFAGSTTVSSLILGNFSGIGGSDLIVIDGNNNLLLEAELSGLQMGGVNGLDFGMLTGLFNLTGGSLQNIFSADSELFAMQLNLSSNFGKDMFLSNFTGLVDGGLISQDTVAVPEPEVFMLFSLGLGLLVMGAWQKSRPQPGMQGRIS